MTLPPARLTLPALVAEDPAGLTPALLNPKPLNLRTLNPQILKPKLPGNHES